MADLFSVASLFWVSDKNVPADPQRAEKRQELEKMLMNSPFLSQGEKEKMAKVIPLFSDEVIGDLKETLIRQNLRFLQKKSSQ